MLRYHFHLVQDATRLADVEGADYCDLTTARVDAIRQIRAMIADDVRETGVVWLSRRIDIAESDGTILGRVAFADGVQINDTPHRLP